MSETIKIVRISDLSHATNGAGFLFVGKAFHRDVTLQVSRTEVPRDIQAEGAQGRDHRETLRKRPHLALPR